jgi:hypothetical protein
MTLHFGDRVPCDGTLRCERCGHGIARLDGDVIPRCYCGGEAFTLQARRCDAGTPRPKHGDAREPASDLSMH